MESLFAERFKFVREKRGLTLEEIATGIGSHKSTLSQYENGKRKADQAMIIKIAENLGVSADYLLGLTEDPYANINQRKEVLPHQLNGYLREFFSSEEISQEQKDEFFKNINTMYWKYKR